jgi:hypothetical protein
MKRVALVVVVTTAIFAYAFRPQLANSLHFWLAIAIPYLLLSGLALHKMWDDGTLIDILKPRWGDVSIAALVTTLLFLGSWAGRAVLAPAGTARQAWVFRIYLQIGEAEVLERSVLFTAFLLLIPILEELVWRGMILSLLTERLGTRRAWPMTALLYGLVMAPTLFTLGDPVAGPNPMLLTAGLFAGLFWSFAASVTGRLPPVIISHVAFTYFSAVQFRWPGA